MISMWSISEGDISLHFYLLILSVWMYECLCYRIILIQAGRCHGDKFDLGLRKASGSCGLLFTRKSWSFCEANLSFCLKKYFLRLWDSNLKVFVRRKSLTTKYVSELDNLTKLMKLLFMPKSTRLYPQKYSFCSKISILFRTSTSINSIKNFLNWGLGVIISKI